MTTLTAIQYDTVGRPLRGPDGAYAQTPAQIQDAAERLAGQVRGGVYSLSLLRSYLGDMVNHSAWAATLLADVEGECA